VHFIERGPLQIGACHWGVKNIVAPVYLELWGSGQGKYEEAYEDY
jgi:hypothetical protein